jgi:hypothetical protein
MSIGMFNAAAPPPPPPPPLAIENDALAVTTPAPGGRVTFPAAVELATVPISPLVVPVVG